MAERSKFQFRMRDLLWAVSLIGVGLGLAIVCWKCGAEADRAFQPPAPSEAFFIYFPAFIASYIGAAMSFGAGIGILCRKKMEGVLLFAGLAILFFCISMRGGGNSD